MSQCLYFTPVLYHSLPILFCLTALAAGKIGLVYTSITLIQLYTLCSNTPFPHNLIHLTPTKSLKIMDDTNNFRISERISTFLLCKPDRNLDVRSQKWLTIATQSWELLYRLASSWKIPCQHYPSAKQELCIPERHIRALKKSRFCQCFNNSYTIIGLQRKYPALLWLKINFFWNSKILSQCHSSCQLWCFINSMDCWQTPTNCNITAMNSLWFSTERLLQFALQQLVLLHVSHVMFSFGVFWPVARL